MIACRIRGFSASFPFLSGVLGPGSHVPQPKLETGKPRRLS